MIFPYWVKVIYLSYLWISALKSPLNSLIETRLSLSYCCLLIRYGLRNVEHIILKQISLWNSHHLFLQLSFWWAFWHFKHLNDGEHLNIQHDLRRVFWGKWYKSSHYPEKNQVAELTVLLMLVLNTLTNPLLLVYFLFIWVLFPKVLENEQLRPRHSKMSRLSFCPEFIWVRC